MDLFTNFGGRPTTPNPALFPQNGFSVLEDSRIYMELQPHDYLGDYYVRLLATNDHILYTQAC